MGAEVGATCSFFSYDAKMRSYLQATGRKEVADEADKYLNILSPDKEVTQNPAVYYDQYVKINLSELEPYINGPFSPDIAHPISEFPAFVKEKDIPRTSRSD